MKLSIGKICAFLFMKILSPKVYKRSKYVQMCRIVVFMHGDVFGGYTSDLCDTPRNRMN